MQRTQRELNDLTERLWDRYVLPAAIAANRSNAACDDGYEALAETVNMFGPWEGLRWAKSTARSLWP